MVSETSGAATRPRRPRLAVTRCLAAHQLGQAECQVERLAGVQARIEGGFVARRQLLFDDVGGAAEALPHILAPEPQGGAPRPHLLLPAFPQETPRVAHSRVAPAR